MNSESLNFWRALFSNQEAWPDSFFYWIAISTAFFLVLIPYLTLHSGARRKVTADLQARVGPSLVGLRGMIQPVADVLKIFRKAHAVRFRKMEVTWLLVLFVALFSTMAVLPIGAPFVLVQGEMTVFLPFWSVVLLALASVYLGGLQGGLIGHLSGLRLAARGLSGVFPALICIVSLAVDVGKFDWVSVNNSQGFWPLGWNAFRMFPFFHSLGLVVFLFSGLVVNGFYTNRILTTDVDFNVTLGGRLTGTSLMLFRFARFYGFFLWLLMGVVLYCGGWTVPEILNDRLHGFPAVLVALGVFVLLVKISLLSIFTTLLSKASCKIRVDQATDFSWKVLSPLALFVLVGVVCRQLIRVGL